MLLPLLLLLVFSISRVKKEAVGPRVWGPMEDLGLGFIGLGDS